MPRAADRAVVHRAGADHDEVALRNGQRYVHRVAQAPTEANGDLAVESEERFHGGFRLIEAIEGRDSEVLELPSGRTISAVSLGQALFGAGDLEPFVRSYQCAQTGENDLELRIVWSVPPTRAIEEHILKLMRPVADPDTTLRVRKIDRLDELPSGKTWVLRREY